MAVSGSPIDTKKTSGRLLGVIVFAINRSR